MKNIGGRPKTLIDGIDITITLEREMSAELMAIAERFKLTRSEVARRMIETGLDSYNLYSKIGVIKLAEIVKRSREANESQVKSYQLPLF